MLTRNLVQGMDKLPVLFDSGEITAVPMIVYHMFHTEG